jgi:hypothetical protein
MSHFVTITSTSLQIGTHTVIVLYTRHITLMNIETGRYLYLTYLLDIRTDSKMNKSYPESIAPWNTYALAVRSVEVHISLVESKKSGVNITRLSITLSRTVLKVSPFDSA